MAMSGLASSGERASQDDLGMRMHELLRELYPICRSITGEGVRQTLRVIQKSLPIEMREVPTGTPVFDWSVPREWTVRDAWIRDEEGNVLVSFNNHNLHLMSYSSSFRGRLTREQLEPHLRTLPNQPDCIPYVTSYYKEDWAFCVKYASLATWPGDSFDVLVDTSLQEGSLTYGEIVIPGSTPDEFLFSTHICHPSLANDNLSGVVVAHALAAWIGKLTDRRYTYRFVFLPGTIGAITWLAVNESTVARVQHGLVISGVGDPGPISYKRSRQGNATIDLVSERLLRMRQPESLIERFSPYGYDERQYCSPGFNLPMGRVSRSPFGTYPQYHTSDDTPDFVKPESLADSLDFLKAIVNEIESLPKTRSEPLSSQSSRSESFPRTKIDLTHHQSILSSTRLVSTNPKCEPQLGRRGLYRSLEGEGETMAMLWVLSYCDGQHTLEEVATVAGLPIYRIIKVASILLQHHLLERLT
jgi:aminopeptidase-like protein